MALHYDYSKVEDHDNLIWDENDKMKPMTTGIIFSSIPVMIGEITEENWEEFYFRVSLWENLFSTYSIAFGEDGRKFRVFITPEDVKAHIGLKMNVCTESRSKFMKNLLDQWDKHIQYEIKHGSIANKEYEEAVEAAKEKESING